MTQFTSHIDFSLTKKRLFMLSRTSSKTRANLKLFLIAPVMLAASVLFCTEFEQEAVTERTSYLAINGVEVYSEPDLIMHFEHPGYGIMGGANVVLSKDKTPFTGSIKYYRSENNELSHEIFYRDGFQTKTLYYDKEIFPVISSTESFYENGLPTEVKYYARNGELAYTKKAVYTYDLFAGIRTYNTSGTLISEALHLNETQPGLTSIKEWYPDGQLKFEAFSRGVNEYHGLVTSYDEDGSVLEQERYENGELVEKIK